ncbi:MAG: hypothetical protein V4719_29110 [Planctomycetota bacterium]
MIRFPDESPLHFSYTPGKLVLVDPNLHEIAQVDEAELQKYLDDHKLCSDRDLDGCTFSIRDIRLVFDRELKSILQRYTHFPTVKMPFAMPPASELVEFNGYHELYSKQSIADVVVKRLRSALIKYPFAGYTTGLKESHVVGLGQVWRDWFTNDVLSELPEATIVVPPGDYPKFRGAFVGRKNAESLSVFLEKLPQQDWQTWASSEELNELTN